MDASMTALRVFQAVAEQGTFTAAGRQLGYTQSAVSRQVATLERTVGRSLFERRRDGVVLTAAGTTLLRHAITALAELDAAARDLDRSATPSAVVRVGSYFSAGAAVLSRLVTTLRARPARVRLVTRDGSSPALVRAVRAGTLDLAVVTSRPPFPPLNQESPALRTHTVHEGELRVAAAASGPFAGRASVAVEELADVDWIATPGTAGEPMLGVWPGLASRPRIAHTVRDWLTKLDLVAAGAGLTTIPPTLAPHLPPEVVALRVTGGPSVRRRVVAIRRPGRAPAPVQVVIDALADLGRAGFGAW